MLGSVRTKVTRITKGSFELNAADILELLRKHNPELPASAVTSNLRVYFSVPGGGDWSTMDIDITDRNPVHIDWNVVEEEREDG